MLYRGTCSRRCLWSICLLCWRDPAIKTAASPIVALSPPVGRPARRGPPSLDQSDDKGRGLDIARRQSPSRQNADTTQTAPHPGVFQPWPSTSLHNPGYLVRNDSRASASVVLIHDPLSSNAKAALRESPEPDDDGNLLFGRIHTKPSTECACWTTQRRSPCLPTAAAGG